MKDDQLDAIEESYRYLSSAEASVICGLVDALKLKNETVQRLIDELHDNQLDYQEENDSLSMQRDEMIQILQYYATCEGQGHAKSFLDSYYAGHNG